MIRFAGVDTLLEDDAGELSAWLRRYLPVAVSDVFIRPQSYSNLSVQAHGGVSFDVHAPHWPPLPELRFNCLYWPTGATRWGCCFLLATDEQRIAIEEELDVRGEQHNPGKLSFSPQGVPPPDDPGYGDGNLTVEMYLLAPRPVSVELENETRLWILPLVDARYYWQWKHVPVDYEPETWEDAFTELFDDMGETLTDLTEFDEDYGDPDLDGLDYLPVAPLLDVLAFTTGRRIVRGLNGEMTVQDIDAATDQLQTNRQGGREIAGDTLEWIRSVIPAQVILNFPDDPQTETAATHGPGTETADTTQVFQIPDVDTGLITAADFAAIWAEEYYEWIAQRYDHSFVGIHAWEPTGFDDCLEIPFGTHVMPGELLARTRVKSLPYNWAPPTLLPKSPTGCFYWWEITIFPGTARPTSGSAVFEDVVIDGVTADVTVQWNDTGATFTTHLLGQFSSLTGDDFEATGSLPGTPIDVKWKRRDKEPSWPLTEGASTLNNGAQCIIRQRNPR